MKTASTLTLLCLFAFLFAVPAAAQCSFSYTPNYTTYTTQTTALDGSGQWHVLTTVSIDGTSQMGLVGNCPPQAQQQMQNQLNSATHTPKVYNVVNSVGGWSSGSPSCPSCYIWTQSTVDSGPVPAGQYVTFSSQQQVQCSVGGSIFLTSLTNWPMKIVVGSFGLQFQDASGCHWFPTCTGTCTKNGRFGNASAWPDDVCPKFLFCADLYINALGIGCFVGSCYAKTFDSHLCS
jgi:hypothetical protein